MCNFVEKDILGDGRVPPKQICSSLIYASKTKIGQDTQGISIEIESIN